MASTTLWCLYRCPPSLSSRAYKKSSVRLRPPSFSSWKMCLPETAVSWSFVWEFFAKDVNLWAQSYLSCQRSKIQSHVKSPVHHIPVPGRRFFHFYVDMVGPLPQSNGFSYLFTIIDHSTRWITLFGVPSVITSDHGAQFTSSVWSLHCASSLE